MGARVDRKLGRGGFVIGLVVITALSAVDVVRYGRGELVPSTDPVTTTKLAILLLSGATCLLFALWGTFLFLDASVLRRSQAPALRAARTAGLLGLLAAAVVAGAVGAGFAQGRAFDRAERAADRIWVAIEAYRDQHGVAPTSLEDLVPDHLDSVPPTTLESAPRFEYEPDRWGGTLHIQWGSERYGYPPP